MSRVALRRTVQRELSNLLRRQPTAGEVDAADDRIQQILTSEPSSERQYLTWSQVKERLAPANEQVSQSIVRWLVDHGVLFRGVILQCPNCSVKTWYLVDRLSSALTCDGCRATSPTPFEVGVATWSYRLNELVAQAIDQGVLAHLIAVRRVRSWGGWGGNLLGYVPGVEFIPVAGSKRRAIEVDLLWIAGGRVIIGECKMSTRLSGEEVERLSVLARLLNCSRLIFATPAAAFDDQDQHLRRAQSAGAPARVEFWSAGDLVDCFFDSGRSRHEPADYLERVARWIDRAE